MSHANVSANESPHSDTIVCLEQAGTLANEATNDDEEITERVTSFFRPNFALYL